MSVRPRWSWERVSDEPTPVPPGPAFTSRFDAEQWLGEHWRDLSTQGVLHVQLVQEGTPVGKRIDLRSDHRGDSPGLI